jgi:6-phosphogluconolactonase
MTNDAHETIVRQFEDAAALSAAAAETFAEMAQTAVSQHGRFLVALSGGGTPEPLYRCLARPPYAASLPWRQTHVFWGDERLVPPEDAGSNYGQARDLLLQHVPIPAENVHRVRGEWEQEAAVADYRKQLAAVARGERTWPRFDLILMGLGSDGHTASLFPGPIPPQEETQAVMGVAADYDGRPAARLTLTPLVFNDAKTLLFLVTGERKAEALTAVLAGPPAPEKWPAQRIHPHHGVALWYVDNAAAAKL